MFLHKFLTSRGWEGIDSLEQEVKHAGKQEKAFK